MVVEGQLKSAVHDAVAKADFGELLRIRHEDPTLSGDAKQAINGVLGAVKSAWYTDKPLGLVIEMAVIYNDPQVLKQMQRSVSDPHITAVIEGVVSGLNEEDRVQFCYPM